MEEQLKAIEEVTAAIPEEQREIMKKHGITMMRRVRREGENEDNGGTTQRIVDEDSLQGYLATGWRVITTLPSGNIVIEY